MKVLHLLRSNRFSGAENVVCQIIGIFRSEQDIEMVYCSPDGQIREALAERDIHFVPINELSIKEVKRVIREQKPDIIHAHDMGASVVAACACGNIPLVSHIHNNNFDSRGFSFKSILYFLAALKAKHIFWVSQSSFDGYAFHKYLKSKSTVLYNIIDINALYKKMEMDTCNYDYDVIYVGRLTYQKNPQRLMRVLERIANVCPNVKMAVVGTGDLEDAVKTLSDELGLQNNVRFLGFQSNPLKIVHDTKVMVMTSRWEGTPMCALEAMALGVPVVSTPTDGLCELIIEGDNGYLSDDDEELARRVIELISDSQKREQFSEKTKTISIKKNNREIYKAAILKCYKT